MLGASINYTGHLFTVYLLGASEVCTEQPVRATTYAHGSTIFGMYEYAHKSKYICFSAHAYQNPEVTVWSRISSENRRTVLISMLGASFYCT